MQGFIIKKYMYTMSHGLIKFLLYTQNTIDKDLAHRLVAKFQVSLQCHFPSPSLTHFTLPPLPLPLTFTESVKSGQYLETNWT